MFNLYNSARTPRLFFSLEVFGNKSWAMMSMIPVSYAQKLVRKSVGLSFVALR
jgi:hypothetical protein